MDIDRIGEIRIGYTVEEVEVIAEGEFTDGVEGIPVIPLFDIFLIPLLWRGGPFGVGICKFSLRRFFGCNEGL